MRDILSKTTRAEGIFSVLQNGREKYLAKDVKNLAKLYEVHW